MGKVGRQTFALQGQLIFLNSFGLILQMKEAVCSNDVCLSEFIIGSKGKVAGLDSFVKFLLAEMALASPVQ